ncbi:MAG: ribosomal protein S18-alanine N-acetyltransferase [Candidatus Eisenbacteria bacterium]
MTHLRGECGSAGEAGAEVEIRPMSLSDLDGVTAIEQRTFANPWSRGSFERDCIGDGTSTWVAVRGGEVIGYIVSWIVRDEIHIGNIAVAPDVRRRGTGRCLLARALADAAGKGVGLATLEARESNTGAIRLYESFAFRPVAIRKSYYADSGEDAIVMIADLGAPEGGAPPGE